MTERNEQIPFEENDSDLMDTQRLLLGAQALEGKGYDLDAILAENGSDKEHILQASVYMADVSHVAEMNAVWDKWVVPGKEPARVCCQAPLVSPAYKVEITLVAAVKE